MSHSSKSVSPQDTQSNSKQRRARSQLSCRLCRQGKLKCNREHPACDQCIKRNRHESCAYLPPAKKSKSGNNVKSRIHELEQLVVDLMKSNDSQAPKFYLATSGVGSDSAATSNDSHVNFSQLTPPIDPDYPSRDSNTSTEPSTYTSEEAFGQLRISKKETSYVGESHWTAILDSISDLKRDLSDDEVDETAEVREWRDDEDVELEDADPKGMGHLLRSPRRMTKLELLQALPPRAVMDRLLAQWFNAPDPFKSVLHPPTFQDEYRQFWNNPQKTPTMWLALLYAILAMASAFVLRTESDHGSSAAQSILAETERFHELSASAATLADYTMPKPYALEFCMVYSGGLRSKNAIADIWLLMGTMVRLALRMGYHRDASHLPNLTPYQDEMRRRIWHILYTVDVLLSFQIGVPSMIRTVQSDCRPPRNLMDHDFSVHSTVLPPSRPMSEITPITYGIGKVRLSKVFGMAAELSHSTVSPSYKEIMDLDQQVETAHAESPSALQYQPFTQSITDKPETIMWRYNLELLYLKTRIVLHRRFMKATPTQPRIPYSRKVCVDSAMRMLSLQYEIHASIQPGGQLEVARWYMGSISTHDFLLAAMVICLELAEQCDAQESVLDGHVLPAQSDMTSALEKSYGIYGDLDTLTPGRAVASLSDATYQQASIASETKKASKAMAVMLARVKAQQAQQVQPGNNLSNGASSDVPTHDNYHVPTTSSDPWMKDVPADDSWMHLPTDMNLDFSTIGDMINIPDNVNWEMWDQQIIGQDNAGQMNNWPLDNMMNNNDLVNDFVL